MSPGVKKKKRKLRSIKTLKQVAWKAFAIKVRARNPKCITCGKPGQFAGHFIHNNDKPSHVLDGNKLWFDMRNVFTQCLRCNRFKHGNAVPYAIFLEDRYGVGIIQLLWLLYNTKKKWTREELEYVIKEYSQ